METEGKQILVDYLTDIADTFRSITGETDTISAENFSKEVHAVAAPSSKNSYQRRSIDEMKAITDMKEGDTCLILQNDVSLVTSDEKEIRVITFPKKVVFETPIIETFSANISGENIFGDIQLSDRYFDFNCVKDGLGDVRVSYNSDDGYTYTLVALPGDDPDFNEENFIITDYRSVDFKTNITIIGANEYIGAFLYGAELAFEGIWQYFDGVWNPQSLGYDLLNNDVDATKDYYNNGEQHGMLGNTNTIKGITGLNNFIQERGVNVKYPTDMSFAFKDCAGEKIPLLELSSDTSNVTTMTYMFSGCASLKSIPFINTGKVIYMNGLFNGCKSLEQVPLLNTSDVTDMRAMFSGCTSLKTVPQFDTSKVTSMMDMFSYCSSLETVPELDASSIVDVFDMFGSFNPIKNFGGLKNLGQAYSTDQAVNYNRYMLRLSSEEKLTHDSLMNVINNLYDIKSKGVQPQLLWLGDTNKAKLTAEEIAIATNKGWNVK